MERRRASSSSVVGIYFSTAGAGEGGSPHAYPIIRLGSHAFVKSL